jgi:predicted aminopeptidase
MSGCYLGHVAAGELRLLRARQPIDALLADPQTPEDLRAHLRLVQGARETARAIGLDVGGQYTSYAPWPGDRVVTTVVAARPGSVEAAGFWFPLLGRLPYKGYFDAARANAEAARLRAQGLDVCVVPVPAFSTLGWFDDPVPEPLLRGGDGRLVETIVHELVHATVYLPDDADFDEGVASFIGEEASVRFFAAAQGPEAAERRRAEVEDDRRLDAWILAFRGRVTDLYAELPGLPAREERRARLEEDARAELAGLFFGTRDTAALSRTLRLNDACLALAATYATDVPRYAATLSALGGDLPAFVARLREAAKAPDPRAALGAPAAPATSIREPRGRATRGRRSARQGS